MAFDAAALEEALERPSITMRRPYWQRAVYGLLNKIPGVDLDAKTVTYEGRILSHRQWVPWEERVQRHREELERIDEDDLSEGEVRKIEKRWYDFIREYLIAIGLPSRAISYIEDLPYGPQLEAVKSFLACQRRAQKHGLEGVEGSGSEDRPETSTPNGSRTRTPVAAT